MMQRRISQNQKMLIKEASKVTQENCVMLENPNISVEKTVEFMKKLTIAAVSTIAYLRDLFPSDAFLEKTLDGVKIYVLQGQDAIPETRTLISWLKSAFTLVHSHHLKKMILTIQKELNTLESYTFSFSYDHDAIHYDLHGEADGREILVEESQSIPEDISKSVRQLMRCILVRTSSLVPLPDGWTMNLKIFVDGNVPQDLLPQSFLPSNDDVINFPEEAETLKLGKVVSKFATFTVSSKSVMNKEYAESEVEVVTVDDDEVVPLEDDEVVALEDEVVPVDDSEGEFDEVSASQVEVEPYRGLMSSASQLTRGASQLYRSKVNVSGDKTVENDSNATNLSEKLSLCTMEEKTVRCICECSDLFDKLIPCESCSTFQHKTCYKFLDPHQVDSHICVTCHDPKQGKICSSSGLVNDPNRKIGALYRQALMYCCNSSQVSAKRIMTHLKVKKRLAEEIFHKLDTDGCLEPATKNKRDVRNVRADFQEAIMGRFFNALPSSNSTAMDVQISPMPGCSEVGGTNKDKKEKRKLSDEKENCSPECTSPKPKHRKFYNN